MLRKVCLDSAALLAVGTRPGVALAKESTSINRLDIEDRLVEVLSADPGGVRFVVRKQ